MWPAPQIMQEQFSIQELMLNAMSQQCQNERLRIAATHLAPCVLVRPSCGFVNKRPATLTHSLTGVQSGLPFAATKDALKRRIRSSP